MAQLGVKPFLEKLEEIAKCVQYYLLRSKFLMCPMARGVRRVAGDTPIKTPMSPFE
jgi:hypothetical protein